MTRINQEDLAACLAHDIVAEVAPHELPLFTATSKAFFRAGRSDAVGPSEDPLGFGVEAAVSFLTPFILVAATEVLKFLWESVKDVYQEDVQGAIERLVNKGPRAESMPLSSEQIAQVRLIVKGAIRPLRLPDAKAAELARAILTRLNIVN